MVIESAEGSSPLARGLPRHGAVYGQNGGIIPARAGFTSLRVGRSSDTGDHPRSRGVYDIIKERESPFLGSSPLARGLQRQGDSILIRVGIIPARAGFTLCGSHLIHLMLDHPRSRGVYQRGLVSPAGHDGSSPLARGLRLR